MHEYNAMLEHWHFESNAATFGTCQACWNRRTIGRCAEASECPMFFHDASSVLEHLRLCTGLSLAIVERTKRQVRLMPPQ